MQVHLFVNIVMVHGILLVWRAGVVGVQLLDTMEFMLMLPTSTPGWSKLQDFKFNVLPVVW
jgi:hypothetical protein